MEASRGKQEAVDAYHAALTKRTRERMPLGWAMQNNSAMRRPTSERLKSLAPARRGSSRPRARCRGGAVQDVPLLLSCTDIRLRHRHEQETSDAQIQGRARARFGSTKDRT